MKEVVEEVSRRRMGEPEEDERLIEDS